MKKLFLAIPCVTVLACAPTVETSGPSGPKQSLGTLSGMVIGGALANDMADGSKNKGIATVRRLCRWCYWSKYWSPIR